ncbi:GumC family protein [Sphingobacterium ginsenosidimutans]|uniref:non-specific protein-tyrosine kinase n=1 Tax=Sphingobacterium ginsenosidimutans TaxID=687845 RepID=A0ABP7ZQM5_9SPHI
MNTIEKESGVVTRRDKSVNIVDLFKYLLFHWRWYVLSVLVFGGFFLYQYSKTPFMYSQSETVMIKTPMNTLATARITRPSNMYNSISVASEILQLKSKELMRQTISRIDGDMSYVVKQGIREVELYKNSPIRVELTAKAPDYNCAFKAIPVDDQYVLVKGWEDGKKDELRIAFDREVNTPFGRVRISKSRYYTSEFIGKEINVRKSSREAMVNYFSGNLKITQMEDDASLLQVSIDDRSPKRAADLITTLITVYNELSLKDKNQIAVNTANFIRARLNIIQRELGSVESDIEQIKTANEGMDIPTAGQMFVNDSRELQTERNKIETDIKLAEMMRQYLTDEKKQNELIPYNTGLVDQGVENQISEYNTILLRRQRLADGSGLENPVIKDIDRVLNEIRNNIHGAAENALTSLKIKRNNIQKIENQAQGKAVQMPEKQRILLSVERQQKVKEELYVFLLNKREENALNQAMTEDNIRVIDPAAGSQQPISPSKPKKFLLGMLLGFTLPTVVLLLLQALNMAVRDRKDIEQVLTVPFLGEIPLAKRSQQGEADVVVSNTGRDPLTEAFRILRTNINFMTRGGVLPKVLTFTSFSTGAGKTFSALNLATTLSYLDKQVVVVDLDLRKGTLSSKVGATMGKGVSHYLADASLPLSSIIHKSNSANNVDIIPIGTVAPNPVELLLSSRLDEMILTLREQYDYIVVDGVPVGIVADAKIVDRISDLTLFIVRAGKTDRRQLPELENIYRNKQLSNLAVVLNGLKLGAAGYGYGYSYGYGYGYVDSNKFSLRRFIKSMTNRFNTKH